MLSDNEIRLPVQYLVDNASSPPEMSVLLISGPSSYRLRYEFLSPANNISKSWFLNEKENHPHQQQLVYSQSCLAMDSKTSTKVIIKFFSSAQSFQKEQQILQKVMEAASSSAQEKNNNDLARTIYEDFEDSKRRVTFRNTSRATTTASGTQDEEASRTNQTVVMNYGIVREAELYTLECLRKETPSDALPLRQLTRELLELVSFFHQNAQIAYGNLVRRLTFCFFF
jgi:hypothetical protein